MKFVKNFLVTVSFGLFFVNIFAMRSYEFWQQQGLEFDELKCLVRALNDKFDAEKMSRNKILLEIFIPWMEDIDVSKVTCEFKRHEAIQRFLYLSDSLKDYGLASDVINIIERINKNNKGLLTKVLFGNFICAQISSSKYERTIFNVSEEFIRDKEISPFFLFVFLKKLIQEKKNDEKVLFKLLELFALDDQKFLFKFVTQVNPRISENVMTDFMDPSRMLGRQDSLKSIIGYMVKK